MPFIFRREGTYYFRCRIPNDLIAVLGSSEIRRSLRTSKRAFAFVLASRLYAAAYVAFQKIRVSSMRSLNNSDAMALLRDSCAKAMAAISCIAEQAEYLIEESDAEISQLASKARQAEAELEIARKTGAIEQSHAFVAQLGDVLGSIGVTMKSRTAPTVTTFLKNTYFDEKQLQGDLADPRSERATARENLLFRAHRAHLCLY